MFAVFFFLLLRNSRRTLEKERDFARSLFWQLPVACRRYHVISDIMSGVDKCGKVDPDNSQTL